ncbi:MAG: 30S ribosomal protein S17 [Candidatus Gracilibacteria bacterium]|jgi:small subunit ribosomal protein S17
MRTKEGIVSSKSGAKSIVVKVETSKQDPKYKKRYSVAEKFHVHDEKEEFNVEDKVTIYETRPLSRLKRWTVEKPSTEKPSKK